MPDFNPLLARRVVTDIGRTQNAIDGALKKLSMLTTDVLEAFGDARLSDAATSPRWKALPRAFPRWWRDAVHLSRSTARSSR